MENVLILIVAVPVVIIFLIAAYAIRQYRKKQRQLREFAVDLGEEDLKSGAVYEGESEGLEYYYQYYAGSKNSPSHFKLWIDCPSQGEFKIAKESRFDSIFKRLGIAMEIQTGDSEFDKEYYIQTDSVAFTRSYLLSPEKREAIKKLFALNYNHITHDGETFEARISPFTPPEFTGKGFLETTLKELQQLKKDMPEEAVEYHVMGTPVWKFKRNFIYTISIASTLIGVALFFWADRNYHPLDGLEMFFYSLDYITPAFIVFLVIAVVNLKGRSSSHKDLLINFFIALFGFPLSGYFGVMAINGYLDPFDSTDHEVLALHKRISQSKDSKNYYVTTKSWRENRSEEEIKVSSGFYQKVKVKSTILTIETKPGKLAFEWVVSYGIRSRN